MKIENKVYRLERKPHEKWLEWVAASFGSVLDDDSLPLRFAVVGVTDREVVIEGTVLKVASDSKYAERLRAVELFEPRKKSFPAEQFGVVQIIPTGVRCEFGGYAGDACPVTNLLAAAADFLVSHPNAVNASEVNEMADNVLYVEGRSLDDFLLGHLGLLKVRANRIGTFIDNAGIEYLDDVVNTLNAARAAAGINCELYTILREEPGIEIEWSESGCAAGKVLNPAAILEAVEHLIAQGVNAVGGVSVIHGVSKDTFSRHLRGEMPNPRPALLPGGANAVNADQVARGIDGNDP